MSLKTTGFLLCLYLCYIFVQGKQTTYEPNWDSLDSRPLPAWYDEAKLGIFIHWGVFSVPSFGSEWFWESWRGKKSPSYVEFMEKNYPPNFQYADFAPQFTTEFFNPDQWADLFKESGAKYVVLTSKHHEGFTNWPSANSWNWNSMDVGPHRDLVGELADAVRNRTTIRFGLYHSLYEWFNTLYLEDKANNYETNNFVRYKTMPELYDIVNKYHPEVVWSDGDWDVDDTYWNSTNFLAWLYNDSPVKDSVVTNDRWGKGIMCKHGGYFTCQDRYNPGVLQPRKWENAMTLDMQSWGYRRRATIDQYLTIVQLIQTFVETISCGGNMLMNIGPTKEGTIVPIMELRLKQMGEWMGVNGEAVYGSKPWKHQNDTLTPGIWYTQNNNFLYAFVFNWPSSGVLLAGSPQAMSASSSIHLLGFGQVSWEPTVSGVGILMPVVNVQTIKAKWVYVFKLIGFQ